MDLAVLYKTSTIYFTCKAHGGTELQLVKNKKLTTLASVGKEYFVSFEMKVAKHDTSKDWRNVIHLSTGGDGSRYPAVWLHKDNKLHIASTVSGNTNYVYNHKDPLKKGRWTHIAIMQIYENDQVSDSNSTKLERLRF